MKSSLIIAILAFILGGALYVAATYVRPTGAPGVACTAEALVCPDGSYVGRNGPSCAFAACPSQASFDGVLEKQGNGYRLLMAAPKGSSPKEVSYSMPLIVTATSSVEALVGTRVSVTGTFTEGNTLSVAHVTAHKGEAADPTKVTLAVGESGFANGVKITVHAVTNDSRCASDVECIQAGWVTASVTLQSDTDKEDVSLSSGKDPVAFDAYQVSLVTVSPEPVSSKQIDSGEYRLTFAVVSNS